MDKNLHIICFDVPYPPDYGGVIEVFWKIRALHEAGVKIRLHCFDYGRGRHNELNLYCAEVNYYQRQTGHKGVSARLPYIVASRTNEDLHLRLLADDYPILMEGVHCTSLLNDKRFNNRNVFLRAPNVEYLYYNELYKSSSSILRKMYYKIESSLLKRYEASIASGVPILSLSEKDIRYYQDSYHAENIRYLPAFIPETEVQIAEGKGCFCLYHGNLSVPENERAALYLLNRVFTPLQIPFVIAGRNPSKKLSRAAESSTQTCIVANPSSEEMKDMIRKAQINILPAFNKTGIKLKLINALFNGRHCITNDIAIAVSGLAEVCEIANTDKVMREKVKALYDLPFTTEKIEKRKLILPRLFANKASAAMLIRLIW